MPDFRSLARATRARSLPVMLAPVAVGATWASRGGFHWGWFFLTLLGAAALHLGANVINDYFDAQSGADKLARIDRGSLATGSGMIESGAMTARGMLTLSGLLFGVAAVIGVVIAAARGWPVLWLGAIGALLAFEYVGPPLKYGYRGRGLGEIGIFIAFGVLPVVGSAYVQQQQLTARAFWVSIVPGLLTTLVLFHHHFLHWRADKAVGKMTPVAVLGPDIAMGVSGGIIVVAYATLVIQVVVHVLPAVSLFGLLTVIPLGIAWKRALVDPAPQRYLNLLGVTLGASVLTAAAIVASFAVR